MGTSSRAASFLLYWSGKGVRPVLTYLMLLEEDADKARFQQLYEQYRGPMYRTALRYLKDEGRAQDAVHDAFVKIALHFQKISALSCMEMGSYIVTIVENRCIEILRKEKRRLDWDEDWDISAPSGAEDEAGYRRLVALVDSMPETYREVLTLRFVLEWSSKEIARTLGLSVGAVNTRISRGRAMLIQRLKEEGYDYDRT